MKKKLKAIDNIVSWVLLIVVAVALIFSIYNVYQSKKTGDAVFLFGYRPVYVLTGSMEPYMLTNSVCLTKEVTSMDDLEVGDVITFHYDTEDNDVINITHRIVSIDEETGYINTKGDNNRVEDLLPLTIDNVDAEVVAVFNQTAWLVAKWQTTAGKVMIISFTLFAIMLYITIKNGIKYFISRNSSSEGSEDLSEKQIEEALANPVIIDLEPGENTQKE